MKNVIIWMMVFAVIVAAAWFTREDPFGRALYVAGRLYIRERGISAEIYTHQEDPLDGMSSLWNGGEVITKEDLSTVQLGDMAEIYTVEGEHLVLECVDIRKGWGLFAKPQGDVIIINQKWVYRFTRL